MENVQSRILALGPMRFAFDLELPDERGDGLDGIRKRKMSHDLQARILQTRMNALTDGPDPGVAGQGGKGLDRVIRHHVVELAHQPLVRSEYDGTDGALAGRSLPCYPKGLRLAFSKTRAQAQFYGPVVVSQCAH